MPLKTISAGADPVLVYGKPAYGRKGRPFLLANTSTNVTVYYGEDLGLSTAQASQIPPLGSVGLDGQGDVWASTLGGGTAVLDLIPGGSNWAASPSQIALEIAESGLALDTSVNNPAYGPPTHTDVITTGPANITGGKKLSDVNTTLGTPAQTVDVTTTGPGNITGGKKLSDVNTTLGTPAQTADVTTTLPSNLQTSGIPPINNHNQLLTLSATSLAIGGSNTSSAAAITQPAYEIYVSCFATAGGLGTIGHVRIDWSDSATGLVVDQDSFWVYPGTGSGGAAHVFKGRGPTKGNQAKIFVQTPGNSAAAVTFAYTFFQSSRLITTGTDEDIWFTVQSPSLSSGPPLVSNDPIARVIASESVSVAANSSSTSQGLPLYNGPVWIRFATTSGTNDAQFEIDDIIDPNINQDTVFKSQSDATGRINVAWRLPRIQCAVILTNQNAAAKTLSYQILAA